MEDHPAGGKLCKLCLFLRTISQEPEKWGPESEDETVIIVFGNFPGLDHFNFQEQSEGGKQMFSAQVLSPNNVSKTVI